MLHKIKNLPDKTRIMIVDFAGKTNLSSLKVPSEPESRFWMNLEAEQENFLATSS